MRKTAKAYILLCIILGLGLLIYLSIRDGDVLKKYYLDLLFLAILGVIAESQSLAIDENKAISIAFAISFSTLLLFGLAAAAWVSFCMVFFSIMDYGRGHKEHVFNTPLHKSLFNSSNYILSILACGVVFELLGGNYLINEFPTESVSTFFFNNRPPIGSVFVFISERLIAIIAGLIVHVLVNTLMIMVYFLAISGPHPRPNIFTDWLRIFQWSVLTMVSIGMLGVFLTVIFESFGPLSVLLFFAPFMMFRYAYVGFTSIQKGYIDTIKAFSAALEAKDHYTIGHARRVEKYCEIIAAEMGLSSDRTKVLKYASLLHDIGKIGISEAILNKADRLTDEEYNEIKKHPVIGAQMLEGIQFLKREVRIIRAHHVHYNGGGYPAEAREEGKMLEAQILCVADSFDAMTSDRAYRPAMSLEEAIDELTRYSGTQFSPEVVQSFIRGLNKRRNKDEMQDLLK